jgi:uncharacterized protein (TIGR01370 family)
MAFTMAAAPEAKAAISSSTNASAKSTKKSVIKTSKKAANKAEKVYNWKISLDHSIKGSRIEKMKKYKLLVIDAQNYSASEVKALQDAGHIVYSYLNIGSVESNRWYFKKFKSLKLKTYDNWEDEYWVDVSKSRWRDFVIENLAASMVKKGVDGFWVDNTDVYEYNKKSRIYKGLVKILTRLRKYNRDVILNGGDQFITPLLKNGKKDLIDGMVQEEVTTRITSYGGHGSFSSQRKDFQHYYERFFKTMKKAGLSVGVLEYTRSSSKRSKIINYCKKNKLNYCIASDLII